MYWNTSTCLLFVSPSRYTLFTELSCMIVTCHCCVHVCRAQAFPSSVESYCEAGNDLFGLVDHFKNWSAGSPHYEVMLIKYEYIFNQSVAHEMFARICSARNLLDAQRVQSLTDEWVGSQKNRKSKVPEACRQSCMYAELECEMCSMPPLCIVPRYRAGSNR